MQVFQDVACTVCGCVCDDLELTVENERITKVVRGCNLCEDWFLKQNTQRPELATVAGQTVELEKAFDEAAAILTNAKLPLVYGLSRSSTPGQRAAIFLAEALGANIDTTASVCHAPSIMAIQEVGESTCTLGEAKNRSDLVVFWGVDPVESHPRHLERYSGDPIGMFLPNGRKDRTIVVIDTKETETSKLADLFIQIPPEADFETIWTLRALLAGIAPTPNTKTGLPLDILQNLLQHLVGCKSGIFYFGLGLAKSGNGHRTVEALLRLVTDLNAHTRFYARRMRLPGDVSGADSALCWQTGFPFSVNFSRTYPRFNPGEYSVNTLLERKEVDACILIGSESVKEMSEQAKQYLEKIPSVALEYPGVETPFAPTVRFTTSVYGVHHPGTAYRMDEVPIPLRKMLSSDFPSDEEVLNQIRERI